MTRKSDNIKIKNGKEFQRNGNGKKRGRYGVSGEFGSGAKVDDLGADGGVHIQRRNHHIRRLQIAVDVVLLCIASNQQLIYPSYNNRFGNTVSRQSSR